MAAPYWLITYTGIDGTLTTKPVRTREDGWPEYTQVRRLDPDACLYMLRQEGLP